MTKYKASRVGVETPRREARPNAALLEPAHRAGRLNRPLWRRRAPGMSRIRSPLEERRRRENPPHQRLETREVLDDLDPGGEEATVGRTVAAPGVVDVDRIDSHQHRPTLDQARRQVRVDERVVRVTVGVGPPGRSQPVQRGPPCPQLQSLTTSGPISGRRPRYTNPAGRRHLRGEVLRGRTHCRNGEKGVSR